MYGTLISMSDSPDSDEHVSVMQGVVSNSVRRIRRHAVHFWPISAAEGPMSSLLQAAAQNLSVTKRVSRPVCIGHFPAVMSAAGSTVCTQRSSLSLLAEDSKR